MTTTTPRQKGVAWLQDDPRTPFWRGVAVVTALAALAPVSLAACSDDEPAAATTTTATTLTTTGPTSAAAEPVRVDLIDDAVAALEAELGGPQDYFEINATSALVNLFVRSGDEGATAWVFLDGELSSEELEGTADGATFRADALDFDPATVLATVTSELPTTRLDVFEVLGGPEGTVGYTIVATSAAGGQLLITVAADGSVIEANPV